jgi:hypothetical protein
MRFIKHVNMIIALANARYEIIILLNHQQNLIILKYKNLKIIINQFKIKFWVKLF